ncbi:zinc finger protein 471-like [Dermochelys coriacea]|uniref:zinc finger protein 471-like n=1 Tax=Dermochelys coriacea TaxID=27794 RepID=UPI001CA94E15|nr:zinc finger protein 471-like [Dermochelys coriacea]XP_043353029.1 zinc finger protein 471-like [Dermochelys coriacea]
MVSESEEANPQQEGPEQLHRMVSGSTDGDVFQSPECKKAPENHCRPERYHGNDQEEREDKSTHLIRGVEKIKDTAQQRISTGERPNTCSDCGKNSFGGLPLSCMRESTQEKNLISVLIVRKGSARAQTSLNIRVHTGGKPYKCLKCGKSFGDRSTFSTHQRIRMGERPYKCLTCGESFRDRSTFNKHQRIHMGEKPHKCPKCGKNFHQLTQLIRHKRLDTGERPHKCLTCGKSFRDRSTFNEHQ